MEEPHNDKFFDKNVASKFDLDRKHGMIAILLLWDDLRLIALATAVAVIVAFAFAAAAVAAAAVVDAAASHDVPCAMYQSKVE